MTTVSVQHKDVLGQVINPSDIVLHVTESPTPKIVTKVTEHKVVLNGNSAVSPHNCVVVTTNLLSVGSTEVDALRKKYAEKIDFTTDLQTTGKPLRFVIRGYGKDSSYSSKVEQIVVIEMRGTTRTDYSLWVDPVDAHMQQAFGLRPSRNMYKESFEKRTRNNRTQPAVPRIEDSWSVYMWSLQEFMMTQQRLADIGLAGVETGKPISTAEWNNMMSGHIDLQVNK